MADATNIEWMVAVARSRGMRAAVWNPVRGCSPASEGCRNCWAAGVANMRQHNPQPATQARYQGLVRKTADGRPVFNGVTRLVKMDLDLPLRTRKPTAYFVGSESDLFGEGVQDEWLDRIWAVMAMCPQHLFICLTKRPARMRAYLSDSAMRARAILQMQTMFGPGWPRWFYDEIRDFADNGGFPLDNVWLGVSVEDQAAADERIPELLATPAALRWVSAEPLLGPVSLNSVRAPDGGDEDWFFDALQTGDIYYQKFERALDPPVFDAGDGPYREHRIDWVVSGGESGPNARPAHPDWFRDLRDQCAAAEVPFFFKQWGEYLPVGQNLPGSGKVHGATAVKPGRMKLHYGGTAIEPPKHAFAERGVECASTDDGRLTFRVGKKAAGYLLDGIAHLAVPEVGR